MIKDTSESLILYKFKPLKNIEHVFDILIHKRFYCSTINELNDIREASMEMNASLKVGLFYFYPDIFNAICKEFRILSLAETKDNHLMWAHYADGYRGIAIKVLVSKKEVIKVRYRGNALNIEKIANNHNIKDVAIKSLRYKYSCWRYEKEYRVIRTENQLFDNKYFQAITIQSVILGPLIDKNIETVLIDLCRKEKIRVERCTISNEDFYFRSVC